MKKKPSCYFGLICGLVSIIFSPSGTDLGENAPSDAFLGYYLAIKWWERAAEWRKQTLWYYD